MDGGVAEAAADIENAAAGSDVEFGQDRRAVTGKAADQNVAVTNEFRSQDFVPEIDEWRGRCDGNFLYLRVESDGHVVSTCLRVRGGTIPSARVETDIVQARAE